MLRRPKAPVLDPATLDEAAVADHLTGLGVDGLWAEALDRASEATTERLVGLSTLSSHLAVTYLDRMRHPIPALGLVAGAYLVTKGYAAQHAVEVSPAAFGATSVPVLGTLPAPKGGRPPADLLTRVVRATRRPFPTIRAVGPGVWDGLVVATAWRVNRDDPRGEGPEGEAPSGERPWLPVAVVDGFVRIGWVLRQVDLHYGGRPAWDGEPG